MQSILVFVVLAADVLCNTSRPAALVVIVNWPITVTLRTSVIDSGGSLELFWQTFLISVSQSNSQSVMVFAAADLQIPPPGPSTSSSWGSERWRLWQSHQSGWSGRWPGCPTRSASQTPASHITAKHLHFKKKKKNLYNYMRRFHSPPPLLCQQQSPSRVPWWHQKGPWVVGWPQCRWTVASSWHNTPSWPI